MVKIEDVLFWILILAIVGIAIWLLFGSPTLEAGLISIGLFVATSEILLWRCLFGLDKKTALGFERAGNDIRNIRTDINRINKNVEDINLKISNIDKLIQGINKKLKI